MILKELHPLIAIDEFMPILQDILTKLEHGEISIAQAIDQVKQVDLEVKTIAGLTQDSSQDLYEWTRLTITISNILIALNDPDVFDQL